MENNRKRIVLIGILGYGKTTLFNRLIGSQEKTQHGMESTTRNIISGFSKAKPPEKQFEVLDTPGLGSLEDKMQHIAGILAAFKQKVVHRIIFVIQFERTDIMIRNIKPTLKFFEKYKENVTIYISHYDKFQGNSIEVQNEIRSKIDNHLKINSVLFNENNSPSYDLNIIKQFNQILEKSQEIYVSLQMDKIIESFDLFELNSSNAWNNLNTFIGNMQIEFRSQVQQPIMNFIEKFPKQITDPLYLNYLDELQNFAKKNAEQVLEKFIELKGEEMNNQFENFHMIIEKINQKKQLHPGFIGNKIKACPYCGLLWVRDYGCNKILCGGRAGQYNPTLILKPFVKFEYKIENNQVKLIQNDIQLFQDKDELINVLKDSFKNGQFQYICEKFNVKNDNDFIKLLEKEFNNSCFDQWIQIIDKRNYDEFIRNLTQLIIDSINKPKEGVKGKFGCGKSFLWEYESTRGVFYKTALQLTSQQIVELNDKDLFTITIQENNEEQKKLSIWLIEQETQLNELIKKQQDQMKVAKQIHQKVQQQRQQPYQQQQEQKQKCRIF